MAHQYLNDGEEEEARAKPANEPERHDAPHEDVPTGETSSHVDDIATTPVTPRRSRRARSGNTSEVAGSSAEAGTDEVVFPSREDDLRDLEAQGFTPEEANRLIDLSVRINEATIKRLQFTRWLVQRGLLDEFSLRSEIAGE